MAFASTFWRKIQIVFRNVLCGKIRKVEDAHSTSGRIKNGTADIGYLVSLK